MNDSPFKPRESCPRAAAADSVSAYGSSGAAPPAVGTPTLIDFSVLDQWRGELGEDTVRSLIGIYLKNSAELLDSLAAEAAQKDMDKLARTAHGLKGSSSNLGITAMFGPARTLEMAARGGDAERALAIVATLRATFDHVAKMLEEYGKR
jgi:HPt (histidine-containing phosphotransfer) domain-containing protein